MIVEELPLFRAKVLGFYGNNATGPAVGPGSYDVDCKSSRPKHSMAPFGTTSAKFFSQNISTTPGAGAYVLPTKESRKGDITTVPFASKVDRFFELGSDNFPGPGQYSHDGDRWGRNGRSHAIGRLYSSNFDNSIPGPGSYNPDVSVKGRSQPRAAVFGKYSAREAPLHNDIPGPGHYNPTTLTKSVYDTKPSSMFATKTGRSSIANNNNNPALGFYNLPDLFMSKDQYRALNPESFSAFGSSAPRFFSFGSNDNPGPGAYTGEIAPRRPLVPQKGKGTSSFLSRFDRNAFSPGTNLGPGAYDFDKLLKRPRYQLASLPFRSSSIRFPAPKPVEEKEVYRSRHPVVCVPRRVHPLRSADVTSSYGADTKPKNDSPHRFYDVKYDWPKPTCTSGSYLGNAPRFDNKDPKAAFPGPGHYDVVDKDFNHNGQCKGSSWGTDGRFKRVPEDCIPGPGYYAHDSTFYKKSFNCTIGCSETM